MRMRRMLLLPLAALVAGPPASAVEIPSEGSCPPYPLPPGQTGGGDEDIVPPALRPGEVIEQGGLQRLRGYLPEEVWERRGMFFFDGMVLEVGPCHRRYPAPDFFLRATAANAGKARLDADGNLLDWSGSGLPFPPERIRDDDPQAGGKWAWDYRYRYQGSGFRGDFRILHVMRRGRRIERYFGEVFFLPSHSVPGTPDGNRFVAGGRFERPSAARGVAWRQFRSEAADRDADRSDEIFVWVPEERKVRRAPPTEVDGLFMPSYTRGATAGPGKLSLPDAAVSTPDPSIAVVQHWRRGFVGLAIRPNAYAFRLVGVRDVLAPLNSVAPGYPREPDRSYGPSGLSLASDRWDIRRAVVLEGVSRRSDLPVGRLKVYVDADTQQPLYWISRRSNGAILEVGIFAGRFSADDPLEPEWEGSGAGFGVILPVAQTMFAAGGESWLRESYDLRSDPPSDADSRQFRSVQDLQRSGR